MKIIVNSSFFSDFIKKGLNNNCHDFIIDGEKGQITIIGDASLFTYIHVDASCQSHSLSGRIEILQWVKIYKILKKIDTQPVVLIFSKINDHSVNIELKGMVYYIKSQYS